jgi:hypothetical protein
LLALLTLVSFRLLRREWSEAAAKLDQGNWLRRALRPRRSEEPETCPPGRRPENPIRAFDENYGYRIRIPAWAWIITAAVSLLLLLIPKAEVGRCLFALCFWAAAWTAAHNGCAAFARERETGRWEELALLPLSDGEIAAGKLATGADTWLGFSALGGCCLIAAALWSRTADFNLWMWATLSLLAVPWAMTRIGGLIGLVTASSEEAQWRAALVSTILPTLLSIGALSGFQLVWATAASPVFSAVSAVAAGSVSGHAWVGSGLYLALGAVSGWLISTRLRQWALPAAA